MIAICYGTRPEVIKLFPLIEALRQRKVPFKTLFTGQHLDLYHDVKELVPNPDIRLETMLAGQSLVKSFSAISSATEDALSKFPVSLVVVQGDTTTAFAISLVAFYKKIPVAHVEAGLRSKDPANPFPEETNRRLISQIASLNFAPTEIAYHRLRAEGACNVHHTGNTIVDALDHFAIQPSDDPMVVITIHRRENHDQMAVIFDQINQAAQKCPYLSFVFPIHPNPNVQRHRHLLQAPNIQIIAPMGYPQMLALIGRCKFIISDSGGLQEEAVYFRKKILVVRKTTERPETISCGLGRLIDTDIMEAIPWALTKIELPEMKNPYGDGHSATRITDIIIDFLGSSNQT